MGQMRDPFQANKYRGTTAKQKQMTNATENEQSLQSRCTEIHMYN